MHHLTFKNVSWHHPIWRPKPHLSRAQVNFCGPWENTYILRPDLNWHDLTYRAPPALFLIGVALYWPFHTSVLKSANYYQVIHFEIYLLLRHALAFSISLFISVYPTQIWSLCKTSSYIFGIFFLELRFLCDVMITQSKEFFFKD